MKVEIGTIATAEEVKARWAYGEISSQRFGGQYVGHGPDHLHRLSQAGEPFAAIEPRSWPLLIQMLNVGRNAEFVGNIDLYGAPNFRCEAWQVADLFEAEVLPVFGRVPYTTFLTQAPSIVSRGELPVFDAADPRVAIWGVNPVIAFSQQEPIIVIRADDRPMILEGYLRTLLWLRKNDPTEPLLAWIPHADA